MARDTCREARTQGAPPRRVKTIRFTVEQAGCTSCAVLVTEVLAPIADVRAIEVDETADCAAVCVAFSPDLSQEAVSRALLDASTAAVTNIASSPALGAPNSRRETASRDVFNVCDVLAPRSHRLIASHDPCHSHGVA